LKIEKFANVELSQCLSKYGNDLLC
jgi:hypothetical protein